MYDSAPFLTHDGPNNKPNPEAKERSHLFGSHRTKPLFKVLYIYHIHLNSKSQPNFDKYEVIYSDLTTNQT